MHGCAHWVFNSPGRPIQAGLLPARRMNHDSRRFSIWTAGRQAHDKRVRPRPSPISVSSRVFCRVEIRSDRVDIALSRGRLTQLLAGSLDLKMQHQAPTSAPDDLLGLTVPVGLKREAGPAGSDQELEFGSSRRSMENRKPWRQQSGGHPQRVEKWLGLRWEAFTYRPCIVFKAHEKCYECGGLAAHFFDGKELCYAASEARFEGEASK